MKSMLIIVMISIQLHCFGSDISPNLTAEYSTRKKMVILKWQNANGQVSAFLLQRSDDNHNWKTIYSLEATDFTNKKVEKYADQNPSPAKNYYRLKMILLTNEIEYTRSIMVIIGSPVTNWILFPVPVRDVLNLQYNGSNAIQGVVGIFIQNSSGYVLIRKRFSSLNRNIQIPVDNLGRGAYDIRIVINDEIIWNQRFIK